MNHITPCLLATGFVAFLRVALPYQSETLGSRVTHSDRLLTFSSQAGWIIEYPSDWRVSSCTNCTDPTAPDVSVYFYNPATHEIMTIENLAGRPPGLTDEQWLDQCGTRSVLNSRVNAEWISVNGQRALKVTNRNTDSTESTNVYFAHGSKTAAIRIQAGGTSYRALMRMVSTFKFSTK